MKALSREPVRRTDYQPLEFRVERVALGFDLAVDSTEVEAQLHVRRADHGSGASLRLHGEQLQLLSIRLDGRELRDSEYQVDEAGLSVNTGDAGAFLLTLRTRMAPGANTELLGLYASSDTLLTQCEAQGFRRITYFPDRPDVLSRYTVCLRADRQRFPVLLSNGNLVEQGALPDGRHFATWVDPHPKPCYLFALVAGRLQCRESRHVTRSGSCGRPNPTCPAWSTPIVAWSARSSGTNSASASSWTWTATWLWRCGTSTSARWRTRA